MEWIKKHKKISISIAVFLILAAIGGIVQSISPTDDGEYLTDKPQKETQAKKHQDKKQTDNISKEQKVLKRLKTIENDHYKNGSYDAETKTMHVTLQDVEGAKKQRYRVVDVVQLIGQNKVDVKTIQVDLENTYQDDNLKKFKKKTITSTWDYEVAQRISQENMLDVVKYPGKYAEKYLYSN